MAETATLQALAAQFSPEQNVAVGKWFGKPCLSVQKKVFVVQWGADMAFKLTGRAHAGALQVEGAHLFDPRGAGNPMKEWVQIPSSQAAFWNQYAKLAIQSISGE